MLGLQAGKQKFVLNNSDEYLPSPFATDAPGDFYRFQPSNQYDVQLLTRTISRGRDV
jgi:hypothetical protein